MWNSHLGGLYGAVFIFDAVEMALLKTGIKKDISEMDISLVSLFYPAYAIYFFEISPIPH